MSIEFACPTCSGTLRVGDESAGRVIRCGACMTTLRVPGAAAEPTAPTDPGPEPPAAPRSPFETGADPDAPAAAIPVARPRAKARDYDDRDRDYDPDRPRRRRRGPPPPAPGRSALFWLGLVGGLFLLIIGGCCGGLYLAVPDAKWQKHESAKGGFKVDLPAPARKDMDKMAGGVPDPNAPMEGTILFRRLQEYVVVYRDLPQHERVGVTDKALMDAAVDGMKSSGEVDAVLSQKDITVNGFPAREVAFSGREGGHYTARVIIADGRLYMLVGGGKLADRDEPNVRRFLDSFEITDPKLKTAAQKKADDERKQAEARKKADEDAQLFQTNMAAHRRKIEQENDAFKNSPYTGPAVPELKVVSQKPGDLWAFGCEGRGPLVGATGPGVRGNAAYLMRGNVVTGVRDAEQSKRQLQTLLHTPEGYSVAGWVRVRHAPVTVVHLNETLGDNRFVVELTVGPAHVLGRVGRLEQVSELKHPWVRDENWHHVALVREGDAVRLYFDGDLVATKTAKPRQLPYEVTGNIGWVQKEPGADWPAELAPNGLPAADQIVGAVDECAIVARPLSEREIRVLMGRVSPLPQAPAPRLAPERPLAPAPRLVPERD